MPDETTAETPAQPNREQSTVHPIVRTPGPWSVAPIVDTKGNPYATLYETWVFIEPSVCGLWANRGTNMKDAELIASAPELLDALRELHDFASVDVHVAYHERSVEAFRRAAELLKRLGE